MQRQIGAFVGSRADEIEHALSLGQIQPAVEKSPFGKFTALGLARSLCQHQSENPARYEGSAMTVDLDHIFARVAARIAHDRKQHFIQNPLARRVANLAMVKAMGFKSAILSIRPNEDSCRDIFRVSTAYHDTGHT